MGGRWGVNDMKIDMTLFSKWQAFYDEKFARLTNDRLKGYWWIYGRESESIANVQELAAWAAVNQEMESRGL